MSDLVAFLTARLDEVEKAARRDLDSTLALRHTDADSDAEPLLWLLDAERMLREVEAKRRILTRFDFASRQATVNAGAEREAWEKIAGALERDVADLASPWSDYPDYDPGWTTP